MKVASVVGFPHNLANTIKGRSLDGQKSYAATLYCHVIVMSTSISGELIQTEGELGHFYCSWLHQKCDKTGARATRAQHKTHKKYKTVNQGSKIPSMRHTKWLDKKRGLGCAISQEDKNPKGGLSFTSTPRFPKPDLISFPHNMLPTGTFHLHSNQGRERVGGGIRQT